MRQRKSLELYPLTMCYFIIRTQKCTKLFFNHYYKGLYGIYAESVETLMNIGYKDFCFKRVVRL